MDSYNEIIKNNSKVIVDFYAPFCKPCMGLNPLIDELKNNNPSIRFIKIDVSEQEEVANNFNINKIPLFYYYNNQELIGQVEGSNETKIIEMTGKLALL